MNLSCYKFFLLLIVIIVICLLKEDAALVRTLLYIVAGGVLTAKSRLGADRLYIPAFFKMGELKK